MTSERPLLLLDVDGVVVPFGAIDAEQLVYPLLGTDVEHVRHHPVLPKWLATLAEHFDLVWATAWEHEANEVLPDVLGISPLPVIAFDDEVEPGADYKLPAIQRFVGERPFAWVDDVIGLDSRIWADGRDAPSLLLEIRADRGLAENDVEKLLAFASPVAGR